MTMSMDIAARWLEQLCIWVEMSLEKKLETKEKGTILQKIRSFKVSKPVQKTCLVTGIAVQLYAYYLGWYEAPKYAIQGQIAKAAETKGVSYIPGWIANGFLIVGGGSKFKAIPYLKGLLGR